TGSYRAPRELNWMVGVIMFLIILAFSLTGYLLPWDTKAYFATEVTIKIAGSAPPQQLGAFIKDILPGGPVVGPPTSQRFFTIHVGDAGHHLADDIPDDETHPFFPDHFWPYPIIAVLMLVAVGLLAAFVQKNLQLEASADPRAVTIPRPDWYFLFLFQFLKLGP